MDSSRQSGKGPGARPMRRADYGRGISTGGKWAIGLAIAGVVGLFALVAVVVSRSHRPTIPPRTDQPWQARRPQQRPADTSTRAAGEAKAPEPDEVEGPGDRPTGEPVGAMARPLRERMDLEYEAAKRRVQLYLGQGRWGDAIQAYERLLDRYDDEELRLRCDPELVGLRRGATRALADKKAEAERLSKDGKHAEARKLLLDFVQAAGIKEFEEEVAQTIRELDELEERAAAAHYAQLMAPIEQMLPEWQLEEALAEVRKLRFDKPKYRDLHQKRLSRIEALVALQRAIIEKINAAGARLSKRAYLLPGLPGTIAVADRQFIHAVTDRGEEKIPWTKLVPDALARLAGLVGKRDDPTHRLAVARLLLELGHHERAGEELDAARKLGADTATDEADLARRQAAPPPAK